MKNNEPFMYKERGINELYQEGLELRGPSTQRGEKIRGMLGSEVDKPSKILIKTSSATEYIESNM